MKTIITSGPPLRRILCSFLFGAAAFCVVPTNIQAAGDMVWVTTGTSIGKYSTDGTTAIPNFITEPLPGQTTVAAAYLGGILVSGDILYVASVEGAVNAYTLMRHPISGLNSDRYVIATYNADTGNVINFGFFRYSYLGVYVPTGMALSGTNLYVANNWKDTIAQINTANPGCTSPGCGAGNAFFIGAYPAGLARPYALAVGGPNGNVLYVTNNAQNSNGDFYISTFAADNGGPMNVDFIHISTGGLYGLALSKDNTILYVSVYSGSAPGVYIYDASSGRQLINGPFVSVNEPYGIAIEGNTLYVASYQDSAIYEFDATTSQLTGSIKVSGAPTNITVEPAQ